MSQIKYIELKSGFNHNDLAWIARVRFSRSKVTVYFNGRALKKGRGIVSNYYDLETGEEYWVSGVKKNGGDRHWAGSGKILVERKALQEYLAIRRLSALDPQRYEVTDAIVQTDIAKYSALENQIYREI